MTDTTAATTQTAMWRSGGVRVRLHLSPANHAAAITNVYGTKPGSFSAAATRRGAPPH